MDVLRMEVIRGVNHLKGVFVHGKKNVLLILILSFVVLQIYKCVVNYVLNQNVILDSVL